MRERLRIALLVSAQLVVMLDTAVLNVALPTMGAALELGPVGTAWLLNSYFLVFGGLLLVAGRAADVVGRRRMFIGGAALLLAGSLVGLLAASAPAVFAARVLQASGAAALSPAAMSMILASTTGGARMRAMSLWGAASTIGGAAGVAVGGVVAAAAGWNAIFAITGAAAAALLVLGARWLPRERGGGRRSFDGPGAALVTAAAFALAFAILSLPQQGWWSPAVGAGLLAAAALGALLVARERRAPDPLFPPRALGTRRVRIALAVNVLGGAARIAAFVLVAFLLQRVLGMGVGEAGLAMLPTSLFGFLASVAVLPRLLARLGPGPVVALGCLLLAAAHALLSSVEAGSSYLVHVLPALALAALGVACSFTPTTLVLTKSIAARDSGVGSGLASATAQLGGMLGIAVFGVVDALVTAGAIGADANALADASARGVSTALAVAAGFATAAALLSCIGLAPRRAGADSTVASAGVTR